MSQNTYIYIGEDPIGFSESMLVVWDLPARNQFLVPHGWDANDVVINTTGNSAISAISSGKIVVWDLATREVSQELSGHKKAANQVAVAADGHAVVSASDDLTVRVWDLALGKERAVLEGHEDRVKNVVLTPDGYTAVSAFRDFSVRVWDLRANQCTDVFYTDTVVLACSILLDAKIFINGDSAGNVHFLRRASDVWISNEVFS